MVTAIHRLRRDERRISDRFLAREWELPWIRRLLQVRFGTVLGVQRAYFTETGSGTICNFVVTPTTVSIYPMNTLVLHT
jgi:hypothetical protein